WPGMRIFEREVLEALVREQSIGLVLQRPIAHVQQPAKWRLPADAHHVTLRSDSVPEDALIRAPMARDVSEVTHSVLVDPVYVPRVLPLGRFVREIEVPP